MLQCIGRLAGSKCAHALCEYNGSVQKLHSAVIFLRMFLDLNRFLLLIRLREKKHFWKFLQVYRALIEDKYIENLREHFHQIAEIELIISKSNDAYWKSEHEVYLDYRKSIYSREYWSNKENSNTIVVGKDITDSLGHLGHFADRCKAKILGLDLQHYVIIGEKFANPWFVEKYLGLHLPIIKLNETTNRLLEIERYRDLDQICLGHISGRTLQFAKAHNQVEINWQNQFGEQPLFTLSDEDELFITDFLTKKGLSKTCWYVTLHLRDAKYEGFRNSGNFKNYIDAVQAIIDKGGWVFRMGSQDTPPFPFKHRRFIDYSNSGERTDRLDVCLLAKCKFHFGTSSGVSEIPPLFGKGVLRVNASRMGSNWVKWKSIEVPRILVRRKDNSTRESFAEQIRLGWLDVDHEPTSRPDLYLRDASSDEILAGVEEIFAGDYLKISKEQKFIEATLASHGIYPSTTISRYFAEKHRDHFQ